MDCYYESPYMSDQSALYGFIAAYGAQFFGLTGKFISGCKGASTIYPSVTLYDNNFNNVKSATCSPIPINNASPAPTGNLLCPIQQQDLPNAGYMYLEFRDAAGSQYQNAYFDVTRGPSSTTAYSSTVSMTELFYAHSTVPGATVTTTACGTTNTATATQVVTTTTTRTATRTSMVCSAQPKTTTKKKRAAAAAATPTKSKSTTTAPPSITARAVARNPVRERAELAPRDTYTSFSTTISGTTFAGPQYSIPYSSRGGTTTVRASTTYTDTVTDPGQTTTSTATNAKCTTTLTSTKTTTTTVPASSTVTVTSYTTTACATSR